MPPDRFRNYIETERSGQGSLAPAAGPAFTSLMGAPPASESLEIRALLAPLWRKKWTITATAMAGVLLGLGAGLSTPPVYRARASLRIEGLNNDLFSRDVNPLASLPNSTPENYLQNEVKMLESETLASRVAAELNTPVADEKPGMLSGLVKGIRDQVSFLRSPVLTAEEQQVKTVQKSISVRTALQTQVLELFFDAPNPELAARGANLAASELVSLNRESRWQLAQDTTDWLNKQAADLKANLESSNQQLQEYAQAAGLVFAGKQSTLAEDRMRQIQDGLSKAEADRAARQARYEAAVANPNALMADSLATGPMRQYQENLQKLRDELAQLKTMYTPTNYRVERVQAQIAETESAIDKERNTAISRLRTEFQAATGLEHRLSQDQDTQLKTVRQQMDKERRYDIKKGEIDATQRLYESVLEKTKEAGAASALRTTNVGILDAARTPEGPYSPNIPLNMAIGLAIGAIGGIGLVLVSEGTDKVRQPGDLNVLNVPQLGVIPSAKDSWALDETGRHKLFGFASPSGELGLVTRDRDSSVMAESFRSALTSVLFGTGMWRGGKEGGRVLVVTSVDVMEGKTTVFTNLGIAAAERNQRVLLIDADIRRPRLHKIIDVPNTRGLTDVLQTSHSVEDAAPAEVEAIVRPTRIPGLWVLPSGPTTPESHKLLYSSDLNLPLQRLRKEFDLILIDTPPMMLYADARIVGRASDGVLMVVRANLTSRAELTDAYRKFMQDQTPVLGTILNHWKMEPAQTRAYGRYQAHYHEKTA